MARLERHRVILGDGRQVGVAIAGFGFPLVVAHGFAAQGLLYAQTLSRLVSMGFQIVAVDLPGHGDTRLPRMAASRLEDYIDCVADTVTALGIRRAMFLGHSMGARVLVEMAARNPGPAAALVVVDGVVGPGWDRHVSRLRSDPRAWARLCSGLVVDAAATLDPSDLAQALRMLRLLVGPGGSVRLPVRLAPAALALLRSGRSSVAAEKLALAGVPAVVVHGELDRPVPLRWAAEAARALDAPLVVVEEAGHSWLLRDPEALPSVMSGLLLGVLGDAWTTAVASAGLDPEWATMAEVHSAMVKPNSLLGRLAPALEFHASLERRPARYRWRLGP